LINFLYEWKEVFYLILYVIVLKSVRPTMAAINSLESNQTKVSNESKENNESKECIKVLSENELKRMLSESSLKTLPVDIIRMIISILLEKDPLSIFDFGDFFFTLADYKEDEIVDLIITCLRKNFETQNTCLFSLKNSTLYSKKNLILFLQKIKPSISNFSFIYNESSFQTVIDTEDFELYEFLYSYGCKPSSECFEEAIKLQDLDALKWFYSKNHSIDIEYCYILAAMTGNLCILKFLKTKNPNKKIPRECLHSALKLENMILVKWLLKNGCEWDDFNSIETAVETKNYNFVIELRKINPPIPFPVTKEEEKTCFAVQTAINNDDFCFINTLRELGFPMNESHTEWAAARGKFKFLISMVNQGFPYNKRKCECLCKYKIKQFNDDWKTIQ